MPLEKESHLTKENHPKEKGLLRRKGYVGFQWIQKPTRIPKAAQSRAMSMANWPHIRPRGVRKPHDSTRPAIKRKPRMKFGSRFFFIKLHSVVRFPRRDVEKKIGARPVPIHTTWLNEKRRNPSYYPSITQNPPLPSYFFFFSSRSRDFATQHPLRPSLHTNLHLFIFFNLLASPKSKTVTQ